ncbi:hypothetical protein ABXR98_13990 [Snodgrassella alvi]|uniref:hypothetical protein n=1 Tax=Snodgrassella alvi TaxID=1196083 RepID=UPI0035AFB642
MEYLNNINCQHFPLVWDNHKTSIYQFLLPYQNADKLPETAKVLPDHSLDSRKIKRIAGMRDGITNYHSASAEQSYVEKILALLTKITAQPNQSDIETLYTLVQTGRTLSYIEDLTEEIPKLIIDFDKLYEFIYWLALNSPDREIIKFSIAILGCFTTEQTELFLLFGMHEEFSLYSAGALQNTLSSETDIENALLTLAKKIDGWGRIHIIYRLVTYPLSSSTKDWLLRSGYQNSLMNEYLAYTCAMSGELDKALAHETIDSELISSTSEIIEALINGGPTQDMHNYAAGAKVCLNYLTHLLNLPNLTDLKILRTVWLLHDFVINKVNDYYPNWDKQIKNQIINKANEVIKQDKWLDLIKNALTTNNTQQFQLAANLYTQYGFDAWEAHFEHQKNYHSDQWPYLLLSDSLPRIKQVIQLANQQYDFAKIATGSELIHEYETEIDTHNLLDLILQELNHFPGVGEDLILIGLNSPVIQNRNTALNTLEAWDRSFWSERIKTAIQELAIIEPDDKIKHRIITLLT